MERIRDWLDAALALGDSSPAVGPMVLRVVVIYLAALLLIRIGQRRLFGRSAALDIVVGIVLGSLLSRGINGTAAFAATLAAAAVLVALHWLSSLAASRARTLALMIEGEPRVLVRDGEPLHDALRASHLSEEELRAALRQQTGTEELARVRRATLERSGEISFLLRKEPRVLEVAVREGVQTVRIELEG